MEFFEKLELLIKENNLKTADISKGTGIPYTTIDSMLKNKARSIAVDNAIKLAAFFDITVEELMKNKEPGFTPLNLTETEIQLVKMLRKLPRDEQYKIIGRVETILERIEDDCESGIKKITG